MARKIRVLRAAKQEFDRLSNQPGFDPEEKADIILAVQDAVSDRIERGEVREFPWLQLFQLIMEFIMRLLELWKDRRNPT